MLHVRIAATFRFVFPIETSNCRNISSLTITFARLEANSTLTVFGGNMKKLSLALIISLLGTGAVVFAQGTYSAPGTADRGTSSSMGADSPAAGGASTGTSSGSSTPAEPSSSATGTSSGSDTPQSGASGGTDSSGSSGTSSSGAEAGATGTGASTTESGSSSGTSTSGTSSSGSGWSNDTEEMRRERGSIGERPGGAPPAQSSGSGTGSSR